jgi:hypothetical protein
MQPGQKEEKKRSMYEKPRLRTIELAAEEVLSIGCKTAPGAPSPNISTCTAGVCHTSTGT